ncbi:MAG: hypothetical protein KGJ80_01160 [Chloroflexota bacterium]|nr:hypothetical protein [Chloroflexota bacterium]
MFHLISPTRILIALSVVALLLPACSSSPSSPNTLAYDAPVSLAIKKDSLLPGTSIAYGGKTDAGAAKLVIIGLIAPKQTGDSVDWQGTPVPDVSIKLSTRVATFDDQSVTLVGTAHIEIANVSVKPGGAPGTALIEFKAPVSFSINKDGLIPGSNVAYGGSSPDGAKFLGIEGYPYRKSLDSLQYVGRLGARVFLTLDLRVLSFSDTNVVLGGTASIRIES